MQCSCSDTDLATRFLEARGESASVTSKPTREDFVGLLEALLTGGFSEVHFDVNGQTGQTRWPCQITSLLQELEKE